MFLVVRAIAFANLDYRIIGLVRAELTYRLHIDNVAARLCIS